MTATVPCPALPLPSALAARPARTLGARVAERAFGHAASTMRSLWRFAPTGSASMELADAVACGLADRLAADAIGQVLIKP